MTEAKLASESYLLIARSGKNLELIRHFKVIGKSAYVVYLIVSAQVDTKTAEGEISYRDISIYTGLSQRTVLKAMGKLEELGYISIKRKKGDVSTISILELPEREGVNKKVEVMKVEFWTSQVLMFLYHASKQANKEGYFRVNFKSIEQQLVAEQVERLKELGIAEEKKISGKKMLKINRREVLQLAKEELGKEDIRELVH
jgi:DNA-binding transcriptional ArsR family regulator